jgi:hypothetical protein
MDQTHMLSICFLITDEITAPNMWREWLNCARDEHVRVITTAHVTRGARSTHAFLASIGCVVVHEVDTAYATPSVTHAIYQLFEAAFLRGATRALLVSQNTIPIQGPAAVYKTACRYNGSVFEEWDNTHLVCERIGARYPLCTSASTFCMLSDDLWRQLVGVWNTHWTFLAEAYTDAATFVSADCSLDEVLLVTLCRTLGCPYAVGTLVYTSGYDASGRAVQLSANDLQHLFQDQTYMFARKSADSAALLHLAHRYYGAHRVIAE